MKSSPLSDDKDKNIWSPLMYCSCCSSKAFSKMGLRYVDEKVGREFVNTGLHYWTTGQDFSTVTGSTSLSCIALRSGVFPRSLKTQNSCQFSWTTSYEVCIHFYQSVGSPNSWPHYNCSISITNARTLHSEAQFQQLWQHER